MSDTEETTQLPDSENPHAAEFAVLDALQKENAELKDARLRALAEVENVRRRAEKEKADASSYAVTKFARDMLGIADNFARALAACPPAIRDAADPQVKAVLDGVEATDRQLIQTLERYGVKMVDTSGKFDPNLHQAIAEVPGNSVHGHAGREAWIIRGIVRDHRNLRNVAFIAGAGMRQVAQSHRHASTIT